MMFFVFMNKLGYVERELGMFSGYLINWLFVESSNFEFFYDGMEK